MGERPREFQAGKVPDQRATLLAPPGRGAISGRGWFIKALSEENQERIAIFFSNPLSILGLTLVLGWVVVAIFAYQIAPFPDHAGPVTNVFNRLRPPSGDYRFGTDQVGRDVFSRLVIGSRISMLAGIVPILLSVGVGVPLGALAGMYRGPLEGFIMRTADTLLSMPQLLLAIAISAALGPSLPNAMLAVAIVRWPYYARLIHGQTLSLKEREFVEAARALGVPTGKIILKHILPNTVSSIIVVFTTDLGFGILTMAGLSFVGMGAQPPIPEWGLAINEGRIYMPRFWWLAVFPGMAIFTLVLGTNLIGDGLRDVFDPRRRR
jgi:peptide/nickel transport system permease protein